MVKNIKPKSVHFVGLHYVIKNGLKILEFITAEPDVQDVPHHSACTSPYNNVGSVMVQILHCLWEYSV